MSVAAVSVIFFDLGDTLVRSAAGSTRLDWVPGAKAALVRLANEDVRLGLLSNTGSLTRAELFDDHLPLDFPRDLIEDKLIVFSSEVGVSKPAYEIFAIAIDRANLPPENCLFCTEDLGHLLAAQEIGMRAVWLPMTGMPPIESLVNDLLATGSIG